VVYEENKYIKPIHTYLDILKFDEYGSGEWTFLLDQNKEYSTIRYSIKGQVIYISHEIFSMIRKLLGFEYEEHEEFIRDTVSGWIVKNKNIKICMGVPKKGYQVLTRKIKKEYERNG
jgi:hypothetical protein